MTHKTRTLHDRDDLQATLDALSAHIAILDDTGRILAVNAAWRCFASENGIDPARVDEGNNYLDVCDKAAGPDAEMAAAFAKGIRLVLTGQQAGFDMEYPCDSPDEHRWFHGRVTVSSAGSGRMRAVVAHENITRRKLAEQDNDRMLMLLDQTQRISRVGGWEYRVADGKILWTDEVYRIYGVDRATYDPSNIKQDIGFYAHHDQKRLDAAFQNVLRNGVPYDLELQFTRADGQQLRGRTTGQAETVNGRVVRVYGNILDITERHRMEEHIRHSQKMESIGVLAGGIAHDFNNILSAIIGYTDLAMQEAIRNTRLTGYLGEVRQAGIRARNLVAQILAFSRQTESERSPVQIHLIVKEALRMLRAVLPATLAIQCKIQSYATVDADPTRIHQVIVNLCTNAFHAMQQTGGTLQVTLQEVEIPGDHDSLLSGLKPGPYLQLSISDTGVGMNASVRQRVFEPYFTTKPKGEGTGLGLSVVLGIVQTHGGTVTVDSQPGVGSTFHVFLPKQNAPQEAPQPENMDSPPPGDERILFVDDEPTLVRMARALLEFLGYRVVTRTDPREALALFQQDPAAFDLVMTDLTMPYMTGDVLAQEILKIRKDIPIMLFTGYSDRIREEHLPDMGIRALVKKPFDAGELATVIRRVLGGLYSSVLK